MNKSSIDIASFREKLLKIRNELQEIERMGNEGAQTVELDQTRIGRLSRMDALQAQAMSIESRRRRSIKLQRIEAALKRIDKDEFGYCLQCGEEIALKRLDFDPTSFLCIYCANKATK
ncbi:RNA polymerase-binding transcription factor DksA [bacterium BMS3Bbin07]|nr:RNA polymerase-binding transcription factor DksA [bacterium BMS3Bbin07]